MRESAVTPRPVGMEPATQEKRTVRRRRRPDLSSVFLVVMTVLLFLYLYVPILVIILLSFSDSSLGILPIRGLTLDWYRQLFADAALMDGLRNSLVVGVPAVLISTTLGLLLAYSMIRLVRRGRGLLSAAVLLPMLTPRLILGVLLLLYFSQLGVGLGLHTIVLAHIIMTLPFVTLIIAARLRGLDPALEEAARDLGASQLQTWRTVLLPLIWPAIVAAALIAFTISFDEMVVSFFVAGNDSTLPVVLWSMVRFGYSQVMNAAGGMIIVFAIVVVGLAQKVRTQ